MIKKASEEVDKLIFKRYSSMKRLSRQVKAIKKKDKKAFKFYKPFYDGLRKGSHMSLMVNFISMFRRLCNLYPAMFLSDYSWMQVIIFMTFSMFSLFYLMNTRPYKENKSNYVNIANEFFTLLVSY